MIDLHNHILPGADDGAFDNQESLEIARQFLSERVRTVVATPHLDPERGRGLRAADVEERVERLRECLHQSRIDLDVLPGQELYLTPEAPLLLRDKQARSLASGPYVLVETFLGATERPRDLRSMLVNLQSAGYYPILAHPERYPFIQADVHAVDDLVNVGVVLQLTAPSLLGEYGSRIQRTAEALLRQGVCALAASDRHHPGPQRSVKSMHARITHLVGEPVADRLLQANPERVLRGEPLVR